MTATRDEHVPCPSCNYDLRGVPAVGDFYRCPECGGLTTLGQLTDARHRRNRARGRIVVGVLLGLGVSTFFLVDAFDFVAPGPVIRIAGAIGGLMLALIVAYAAYRWIRR